MALETVKHYSYTLKRDAEFNIITPDNHDGSPLPVLYLLHGYGDNISSWLSGTDIAGYVKGKRLSVIMPFGNNSFYSDVPEGAYYSYLSTELLEYAADRFNLSDKREEHYILGNSMGGFGAYKLALHRPDYFGAVAVFSGCMDMDYILEHHADILNMFSPPNRAICPDNDLFALIEGVAGNPLQPRFYQWCGTEDFLIIPNRAFNRHAAKLPLASYTYEESAGYHDWPCWDFQLRRALEWFGI